MSERIRLRPALLGWLCGTVIAILVTVLGAGSAKSQACENITYVDPPNHQMVHNQLSGLSSEVYAEDRGDLVEANDCHDTLRGNTGPDQLHGAYGVDVVYGHAGHDRPSNCDGSICGKLYGGAGSDVVRGGDDGDELDDSQAGGDSDSLYGGAGADFLDARDADGSDSLEGGAGSVDTCKKDSGDQIHASCEAL